MSEIQESPSPPALPPRKRRFIRPLAVLALAAIVAAFIALRSGPKTPGVVPRGPETEVQKRIREATEERERAQARLRDLIREAEESGPMTADRLRKLLKELDGLRGSLRGRRDDLDAILKPVQVSVHSPPAVLAAASDERSACDTLLGAVENEIFRWKSMLPVLDPPKRNIVFDLRKYHPWGGTEAGRWVRFQVKTRKGTEETYRLEDRGLRSASNEGTVVAIFEGSGAAREERISFADIAVRQIGEETLTVGDFKVRCLVVEMKSDGGTSKEWISLEDRGEGWFVVRAEGTGPEGAWKRKAIRLWQAIFEIRGGRFPAVVGEFEVEDARGTATVVECRSALFPGHVIRSEERRGETVTQLEAVELGLDIEKRPPFPSKPGPK